MDFGIEVDHSRNPYVVVVVTGELDAYTAPRLRECLNELLGQGHRTIVIDLDAVTFIDSAGLSVLAFGWSKFRRDGGVLSLVSTSRPVISLLELAGLVSVFRIAASVEEALGPELTGA